MNSNQTEYRSYLYQVCLSLSFLRLLDMVLYLFLRVSVFETTFQQTNSFSFFHTSGRNCYAIEDTILFSTSRKNSLPNLFSLVLSYRSKRIANYSYRITLSIEITAVSPLTGRAMAILM